MHTPSTPDPRDLRARRQAVGTLIGLGGLAVAIVVVALFLILRPPAGAGAGTGAGGAAASNTPAPGAVAAGMEAAARYQAAGKFSEAAAILAKLTEVDPTDLSVRTAYGQTLMGLKRYDEAYKQYEAALSVMPAGSVQRIAAGEDKAGGQLHFEAGTCANMAGLSDRAIEHYSMAQTADRREPRYPLYLAMVQLKSGGQENQAAAVASLMRAVHLNPDLGEAWGTLAEIAMRNDQLGIAAQHLERARALQPEVVRWRVVEARLLNRRGQAENAAALLTALPPAQRRDPALLGVLGESYGLMKRPGDAATMYAEAFAAVAPPNAELAYQSALWFERAGEPARAAGMARSAVLLGHKDASRLAALADVAGEPESGRR